MNKFKIGYVLYPSTRKPVYLPKWEIRKSEKEFREWLSHHHSYIFFFDGASQNNLGVVGAGGVFMILEEFKLILTLGD
jgi:hypothetical protein